MRMCNVMCYNELQGYPQSDRNGVIEIDTTIYGIVKYVSLCYVMLHIYLCYVMYIYDTVIYVCLSVNIDSLCYVMYINMVVVLLTI